MVTQKETTLGVKQHIPHMAVEPLLSTTLHGIIDYTDVIADRSTLGKFVFWLSLTWLIPL